MVYDGKCVSFMHVLVGLFFLKLAVAFTGEKSVNSNKQGLTMSNALKSIIIEKSKSNQFLGKEKPRKGYFDLLPSNHAHPNRRRLKAGQDCESGYFYDDKGKVCTTCVVGKYQNEEKKKSCKDCVNGKFQDQTGKTGCKNCEVGRSSDITKAGTCEKCDSGKYTDEEGCEVCKLCDVGKYENEAGEEEACKQCDSGLYQNEEGKLECKKCESSRYQDDEGQTLCKNCPVGFYNQNMGRSSCTSCAAGFYQNEAAQKFSLLISYTWLFWNHSLNQTFLLSSK